MAITPGSRTKPAMVKMIIAMIPMLIPIKIIKYAKILPLSKIVVKSTKKVKKNMIKTPEINELPIKKKS